MIDITFRVKKETNGGELALVSSLNNWDSGNPFLLKWQADCWQGMIRVPPNKDFEYKYVIIYNKSTLHWESTPNRKMLLSKYSSNFLVIKAYDEWENGTKNLKVKEIKTKSQDLRIMTFNIRYDNPKDGKYSWKHRSHLVSSVIRLHKANFIGLQEVLVNQIENLLEDLPEYKYVGVGREDGKQSGEYSPILYKSTEFKVEDSGYFWLSETPHIAGSKSWKTACTRICTWGGFRSITTNNKIYVFNTHLDHQSSDAQYNGTLLILNKITEITNSNYPVLLTGDFNVYENSNVVKLVLNNPNGIKMLNTLNISKHKHHGTSGTFAEFGGMGNGELIDYIFLYDPMKCINVIQHATLTDHWDNGYTPSDHRPVIADLQWEVSNKQ